MANTPKEPIREKEIIDPKKFANKADLIRVYKEAYKKAVVRGRTVTAEAKA